MNLSGKIALFALLALPVSAKAQEVDCNNAQSQLAINICTGQDFDNADAELNRVWRKVQNSFGSDDFDKRRKEKLLASQRAWIAYRDAECEGSVGQDWEGGTGRPMAVNTCATALTKSRTKRLKERYLSG